MLQPKNRQSWTSDSRGKGRFFWRRSENTSLAPFTRVIGAIERQIYLYALFTGIAGGTISAVLLFKAFFAWVETKQDDPKPADRLLSLARYYGYAIANFVSLLAAIVLFEVLRFVLRLFPKLTEFLI